MKQAFLKPYRYYLFAIFGAYLALNIYLSQFYITAQYLPRYLSTIRWESLLLSIIISIAIAFFVAVNSILLYQKYKQRAALKKHSFFTGLGTLGGFATGICPACISGVIPLILSSLGLGISFLALPLQGLEIQMGVLALLGVNTYFLSKEKKVC